MVRHRATGRKTNAAATDRRRAMETHRAAVAEEAQAQAPHRAPAAVRPSGVDWYFVRAQIRHSLGDAAQRDGLRLGHDLLASSQGVAKGARLGSVAPAATVQVARGREVGLFPGDSRQFFDPRGGRGEKTGPNPTDRRRAGSKHHLLTDAQGVPLSLILTGANCHDVTQLMPLVEAIPPIAGLRGAPKRKPDVVQADRAYDSNPLRALLAEQGIGSQIARRRTPHGSGLGKTRWVVERTIAWLHQFRRLRIRFERLAQMHEAFLKLGCCLICWRFVKTV